jgi:hypothetical protein
MITSMTGFGRAAGALSARYFVAITAKSVTHRSLETSVRIPEYLWEAEAMVRGLASDTFARGKVDISIRVQRTAQPDYSVRINTQIANTVVPQLRAIARRTAMTFSSGDLRAFRPHTGSKRSTRRSAEEARGRGARSAPHWRRCATCASAKASRSADITARLQNPGLQRRLAIATTSAGAVGYLNRACGESPGWLAWRSTGTIAREVVVMVGKGDVGEERAAPIVEQARRP